MPKQIRKPAKPALIFTEAELFADNRGAFFSIAAKLMKEACIRRHDFDNAARLRRLEMAPIY